MSFSTRERQARLTGAIVRIATTKDSGYQKVKKLKMSGVGFFESGIYNYYYYYYSAEPSNGWHSPPNGAWSRMEVYKYLGNDGKIYHSLLFSLFLLFLSLQRSSAHR